MGSTVVWLLFGSEKTSSGETFDSCTNRNYVLTDYVSDIRAKGLWTNTWRDTFVDVRVFHPDCPSYLSTAVPALYKRFEKEKKRQYGQRVREVELGSFTPIVFSATGGMGAEAQTFYKRLAGQLSIKKNMPFHLTMKWLRTHLSVILLRSSLMCLRGSRSIRRPKAELDACAS